MYRSPSVALGYKSIVNGSERPLTVISLSAKPIISCNTFPGALKLVFTDSIPQRSTVNMMDRFHSQGLALGVIIFMSRCSRRPQGYHLRNPRALAREIIMLWTEKGIICIYYEQLQER